jgi:hypothetical protein
MLYYTIVATWLLDHFLLEFAPAPRCSDAGWGELPILLGGWIHPDKQGIQVNSNYRRLIVYIWRLECGVITLPEMADAP